jgi:hypothetical protein
MRLAIRSFFVRAGTRLIPETETPTGEVVAVDTKMASPEA